MRLDRSALLALAGAAVFACACNTSDTAKNNPANTPNPNPAVGAPAPSGSTASAASASPDATKPEVVLTGCLQEEKGMLGDYILTQAKPVMSSGNAIGTSGAADDKTSKGEPKGIEQRQLAQAERSYRLSGASDQLKPQIGHEIRVHGSLTDSGSVAKSNDTDIKQGDLAKVDVASVELVADSCNAGTRKR